MSKHRKPREAKEQKSLWARFSSWVEGDEPLYEKSRPLRKDRDTLSSSGERETDLSRYLLVYHILAVFICLSVTAVLLWEQLLASAMSIAAGFGLGVLAAELFAPVLECNVSAADQILPFTVTAFPGDFVRMAVLVSAMLLLAAAALGRIVFTLHAGEALKLGEE